MKNYKNIKVIVKNLLEENRLLADDDKELCWTFWMKVRGTLHRWYIDKEDYMNLPKESTITRARRAVEQMYPSLRGDTYLKRQGKLQQEAKDIVTDAKWNDIEQINRCKN